MQTNLKRWFSRKFNQGFTLLELVVVISLISILTSIGISMFANSTMQERRTAADTLMAMVDLARQTAGARHREVILAFASPEEIPGHGSSLRLGMFLCEDRWQEQPEPRTSALEPIRCRALYRWRNLNAGVVLLPGTGSHLESVNPMDAPPLQLQYGRGFARRATVHALVFHPQSGLVYPDGTHPALLRLVAGSYRHGQPMPSRRDDPDRPPENPLLIHRNATRAFESAP